jgi:F-type H+-transporting ATPase subunit b
MVRFARRFVSPFLFFGALLLCAAVPTLAQEGQPSPADSPTGWVFRWINFAIVLALIVYGFRKAAPAFRSHAEDISQKIAEGTRAREAAEKQRREAQAKLAGIENDVAQIRADAKKGTEFEAQRLHALARTEADAIERTAQAEIAASERAARVELKIWAAQKAVERAEVLLGKELTPATESTLIGTFVAELGENVN